MNDLYMRSIDIFMQYVATIIKNDVLYQTLKVILWKQRLHQTTESAEYAWARLARFNHLGLISDSLKFYNVYDGIHIYSKLRYQTVSHDLSQYGLQLEMCQCDTDASAQGHCRTEKNLPDITDSLILPKSKLVL